jgi:hypothetical protein
MTDQQDHGDPLARALRREAEATRPAFSPLLHARTMSHIRTARRQTWAARRGPFWARSAVAAAVLCAVGLGTWWYVQPKPVTSPPQPVSLVPDSVLPDLHLVFDHVTAPARQELAAAQFGNFDRDAVRLGRYLLESVDVTPGLPARPGPATRRSGT